MFKRFFLTTIIIFLSACSHFFDTDNAPQPAPLMPFTSEVHPRQLWSTKIGSGAESEYLKLSPSLVDNTIYTTSANGVVTATNKINGAACWKVSLCIPITSGPGIGEGLVVIGGRRGEVIALQQSDGRMRWRTTIDGEILAKPVIGDQVVVIKTIDGTVSGLSVNDGHVLWSLQQTEPNLVLRGSSTPFRKNNTLFVGFANGNLAKVSLERGQIDWLQSIALPEGAFSIQRMVDIDADPLVFDHHVFAATYQGKIASLDWHSGSKLWSHDISSYTGMTTDDYSIFISDAKGNVWSFGANNGLVNWQQTELEARNISPPAVMSNFIVVGDGEGYLHWLSKCDGHIAGRIFVGNKIITAPIVENDVLYVQTNNGSLVAYSVS